MIDPLEARGLPPRKKLPLPLPRGHAGNGERRAWLLYGDDLDRDR